MIVKLSPIDRDDYYMGMEQEYQTWYTDIYQKMDELPIIYGNHEAIMANERETKCQLANCGVLLDMLPRTMV